MNAMVQLTCNALLIAETEAVELQHHGFCAWHKRMCASLVMPQIDVGLSRGQWLAGVVPEA